MKIFAKFLGKGTCPIIATSRTESTSSIEGNKVEVHFHTQNSLHSSSTANAVCYACTHMLTFSNTRAIHEYMKEKGWIPIGGYYSVSGDRKSKAYQEIIIASFIMKIIASPYLPPVFDTWQEEDPQEHLIKLVGTAPDYFASDIKYANEFAKDCLKVPERMLFYHVKEITEELSQLSHDYTITREGEIIMNHESTKTSKTKVVVAMAVVAEKQPQTPKYYQQIIADPKAKVVVVKFLDGKKEVVHCSKDDEFDVYVGVAIAEARHKYGNTSRFHRAVDSSLITLKNKDKKKATKKEQMVFAANEKMPETKKPSTSQRKRKNAQK